MIPVLADILYIANTDNQDCYRITEYEKRKKKKKKKEGKKKNENKRGKGDMAKVIAC